MAFKVTIQNNGATATLRGEFAHSFDAFLTALDLCQDGPTRITVERDQ